MEAVYICSIDTETRRNNLRFCSIHSRSKGIQIQRYLLLLTLNIVAGLIIGHGEQEQFLLELQTLYCNFTNAENGRTPLPELSPG